jgi:hypothetical protein
VWRFPALAADYGGGAFFIPYIMALLLIGLPLLMLEIGLGQYYQTGDVGVFGSFHRRWKGVGLCSVALAFILVTYYSVLIAWVINAFFDSFGGNDPWARDGVTGSEAIDYFINEVIGAKTVGGDGRPTRIVPANVGYSFMTCTYCINRSVKKVYVCLFCHKSSHLLAFRQGLLSGLVWPAEPSGLAVSHTSPWESPSSCCSSFCSHLSPLKVPAMESRNISVVGMF